MTSLFIRLQDEDAKALKDKARKQGFKATTYARALILRHIKKV